jgi:DNA primase
MTTLPKGWAQSSLAPKSGGYALPISDLIAQADLPALVAQYAGEGKHSAGRWLFACPHPGHADHSPSFSVFQGRDGKWRAHCLSQCGKVGDALAFVKWVEGCDGSEALRKLRAFMGGAYSLPPRPAAKRKELDSFSDKRRDPGVSVLNDSEAMARYLASRGWPANVAEVFGLRIVQLNRRKERGIIRALHPFHDYEAGKLRECGWQARRLDNSGDARWLSPVNVTLPLYNMAALEAEGLTTAVLCEGPADTVTAWLATNDLPWLACVGVAGAQSWRDEWAELFAGLRVVLAFDNDEAGETFTRRVAYSLRGHAAQLIAACPPRGCNDLGDLLKVSGVSAVRELLTASLPLTIPEAPPADAPATADDETWALILAAFPDARTVCRVCRNETEQQAAYCARCAQLTHFHQGGKVKRLPWLECDSCGEMSLGATKGKSCTRYACEGSREVCEVQP